MSDQNEPMTQSFKLLTGGLDAELDALGVIIQAIDHREIDGAAIARMLAYLQARYSRSAP